MPKKVNYYRTPEGNHYIMESPEKLVIITIEKNRAASELYENLSIDDLVGYTLLRIREEDFSEAFKRLNRQNLSIFRQTLIEKLTNA